jgi:hypothetical protein
MTRLFCIEYVTSNHCGGCLLSERSQEKCMALQFPTSLQPLSGKREEVTVIQLPENFTHTINHVTTLTAQHTYSVASDSVSCVNTAKSLHHIDIIVHGLTNPAQRVAMGHKILEPCTVDCFFYPLLLCLKFKTFFFSTHFTIKLADSSLPPTSSLNTEISLALHVNVRMELYAVNGVKDRQDKGRSM